MEQVKIPRAVGSLLEWWLLKLRPIIADKLHAVYVAGGVAMGDFCGKWSDINACVVLSTQIVPDEAQRIAALKSELERLFVERRTSEWESWRGIQSCFIPLEIAVDAQAKGRYYRVDEAGTKWCTEGLPPFDRFVLCKHGLRWMGEDPAFAPPGKEDLLAQAESDLEKLDLDALDRKSALWLASAIQELGRSIAFWRRRKLISKTEALKSEIERGSPFVEPLRLALRLRTEGSVGIGSHLNLLRDSYRSMAEPAAALIRELLEQGRAK